MRLVVPLPEESYATGQTCWPTPGGPWLSGTLSRRSQVCCKPSLSHSHALHMFLVEKNRLERILPKRGNLTKALSMEASDAKSKILKLKKAKSVDDRNRPRPSVISESSASESNGDLSIMMGSQGSGLQDMEQSNRES